MTLARIEALARIKVVVAILPFLVHLTIFSTQAMVLVTIVGKKLLQMVVLLCKVL